MFSARDGGGWKQSLSHAARATQLFYCENQLGTQGNFRRQRFVTSAELSRYNAAHVPLSLITQSIPIISGDTQRMLCVPISANHGLAITRLSRGPRSSFP